MTTMNRVAPEAMKNREVAWRKFAAWRAPENPDERSSRLAWLDEVARIARLRGLLDDRPFDGPKVRERRRRIRRGLAVLAKHA